jgi:hypothetical protein
VCYSAQAPGCAKKMSYPFAIFTASRPPGGFLLSDFAGKIALKLSLSSKLTETAIKLFACAVGDQFAKSNTEDYLRWFSNNLIEHNQYFDEHINYAILFPEMQ